MLAMVNPAQIVSVVQDNLTEEDLILVVFINKADVWCALVSD
jgi:hypothetical protein